MLNKDEESKGRDNNIQDHLVTSALIKKAFFLFLQLMLIIFIGHTFYFSIKQTVESAPSLSLADNFWVQVTPQQILPTGYTGYYANRGWSNFVYNSARGTVVGWEGYVEDGKYPYTMYSNSLWEYDVASNELRLLKVSNWYRDDNYDYQSFPENQTDSTPIDRHPAFAYVVDENALYAEGGLNISSPFGHPSDTWKFDFNSGRWTEIQASSQPDSDSAAWPSLIYLPTLKKVMVFNEPPLGNSYGRGRTWLFDPATNQYEMLNFDAAEEPNLGAGGGNVLAYDTKRDIVWLFGANSNQSVYTYGGNELWQFNPQSKTWTQISQTTPWPTKRIYQGFVYIPKYDVFLLHGGRAGYEGAWFDDTWLYYPQQNKWEKLNTPISVAAGQVDIAYDPLNDVVVMQKDESWWLFRFVPTADQLDIINSSSNTQQIQQQNTQTSSNSTSSSSNTPANTPQTSNQNTGQNTSPNQQETSSVGTTTNTSNTSSQPADIWGALQEGQWYEVPDSTLLPLKPVPSPPGSFSGVIGAWSGGVYDTKRDRLVIWGGGHNDYGGNEIYAFDINTLKWERIWGPSTNIPALYGDCNETYPDGNPAARHTYDGMGYLPPVDSLISVSGSLYCGAGNALADVWLFDFQTKKWRRGPDVPVTGYSSNAGKFSAYDPVTQTFFNHGTRTFSQYYPLQDKWVVRGEISEGVWGGNYTAALDPDRRLFVVLGDNKLIVWNLNDWTFKYPIQTNGPSDVLDAPVAGFTFDTQGKRFIAWTGGQNIYSLNPDTWTWTKLPTAAGSAVPPQPTDTGMFGRFQYVPSKHAVVVVTAVDKNVFIYKLPQAGQSTAAKSNIQQQDASSQNNPPPSSQSQPTEPVNTAPLGYLDSASPSAVTGWAYDSDISPSPTQVKIYIDSVYHATVLANLNRPDLKGAFNGIIQSTNHGFNYSLPSLSAGTHTLAVYAVDDTGDLVQLSGSPKTITVSSPAPLPNTQEPSTGTGDLSVPLLVQEALPDDVTQKYFQLISGVDRIDEPVRFGLPLPENSGITSSQQLALQGAKAYQFRTLKKWPNGNVQWVLIDALVSVSANQQNKNLVLVKGAGNSPNETLAQDKGSYIAINTGPAQFTVKKQGFNLFDKVVVNDKEIVSPGQSEGIVLTETDGTEYLAANDSNIEVKIEENGPVRTTIVAKGTHKSNNGQRDLDFTVRMHFYRGKTRAKVVYTLRNANKYQLENAVFKKLELKLKTNISQPSYRIALHNGEATGDLASGSISLFQGENSYPTERDFDFSESVWPTTISGYTVKKNGQVIASGNRDQYIDLLYAQAQGNGVYVTFGTRFGAGWWPQGLAIAADGSITAGLFPDGNNKDYAVRFDSHTTREVMFDFATEPKNPRDEFFKFQYPLVGKAQDVSWYNNSGAVWEKLVSFQQEYEFQKKNGWKIPLHSGYATLNRRPEMKIYRHKYWGEGGGLNQYDFAKIAAFNFLRQDEFFGGGYWLYADQRFLYNADWALYHSDNYDVSRLEQEVPGLIGQWGSPMDHFDLPNADKVPKYGLFDGGHRHAYGLSLWYYLTGDERIKEAYIDWGEYVRWREGWAKYTRPFAWLIYNLVDLYRFTGDEKYHDIVWQWVKKYALDATAQKDVSGGTDWQRGFFVGEETGGKGERSNAAFILGAMFPRSYAYLHDYASKTNWEQDRARDLLEGIVKFVSHELWFEYSDKTGDFGFPYRIDPDKPPPQDVRQMEDWYSGAREAFLTFVYGYILTGDPEYLRRGKLLLKAHTESYPYWSQDYPGRHLLQLLVEDPSQFPVWKEMPVQAVKNSDGSYTLSWTVPQGAQKYWIKYSDKPIVPWLNFDAYKRTYEYPPDKYTPFFAAANVIDEPAPAAVGTMQTMKVTGLDPSKTYYFAAKYYIPGQQVVIPDTASVANQNNQPVNQLSNTQNQNNNSNQDKAQQSESTSTPQTRVLKVGPNRQYKLPSEAAKAAQDGDVIEIDGGVYENDAAVWYANNITIKGVGSMRPHLKITDGTNAQGKGIWVIKGDNVVVDNIEFSGAKVPDENGAGIRAEGVNLTVKNCYFHDNEVGILGPNNGGDLIIEYSVFEDNYRRSNNGGAHMHNMYILNADRFILRHSYVTGTMIGHNVKSRAKENYILYNRIMDEEDGGASYQIDIPNGGTTYIIGNLIHQSPLNDNRTIISYGAEGITHSGKDVYIINNTIVNDDTKGTFVRIYSPGQGKVYNNLFIGPGTLVSGNAEEKGNVQGSVDDVVNKDAYDYRLTSKSHAIDAGVDPGIANNYVLTPVWEYIHPAQREQRVIKGIIDAGAYEYGVKENTLSSPPQSQSSGNTSPPSSSRSQPSGTPSPSPVKSGGGGGDSSSPSDNHPPSSLQVNPPISYLPPKTVIDEKHAPLPFIGSSSPRAQEAVVKLKERVGKILNDPTVPSAHKKIYERLIKFRKTYKDREVETLEREKQRLKEPDKKLIQKVKGRILLQVEEHGEAWYVDPVTEKRYYLADGESAFSLLQIFGLGITNTDLERIPVGIEKRAEKIDTDADGLDDQLEDALGTDKNNPDSDNDGFLDGIEVENGYNPKGTGKLPSDQSFASKLEGRIVLQVESHGEAWYIHQGKRYYMKNGRLAYQIMRYLSLGITNQDMSKVPIGE